MNEKERSEILAEVKRRYPPGTEFIVPHVSGNHKCKVLKGETFRFDNSGNCFISGGNHSKNGHSYTEVVYYNHFGGKWADITKLGENVVNNTYAIY